MSAAPRVLACGHVTLDRAGEVQVPGGSAWYAGHTWRGLGARVRVLTAAGPELPAAALAGLEAVVLPAPRTTAFENRYGPGGVRAQRVEAAAPPLDPGALPGGWRDADVLHLAPVLGEIDVPAFTAAVRARVVGLGVQGLVRAVLPGGEVAQPRWEPAPGALAGVDAVFVGEDDLRGQGDLVARLARAVPIVVLTRGARGCEVIARGRARRVGVSPAREVDPTGAGDAFAAGFLFGLARGDAPVDAARLGAAAGAIAVEARGGGALHRMGEAHARAAAVPVLDGA
ncbi:PfkB domain protein [Anaeromyxobacter sp. K]|uniref:PfkB family carbohydrate kinase n=1 Tax=Anaeromyxobacter sp. (strain K) TaxID=447217 RepID=UPI00015F8BF9|nr:PfkB family carbohydrate kinase [Anaeromyxobacter sp. K]ACG74303.1 PfkB domain protein [Anaeromyxobacter sp. K]